MFFLAVLACRPYLRDMSGHAMRSMVGTPCRNSLRSPSTGSGSRCVPVGTYFVDAFLKLYTAIGTTFVLVFLVLRIFALNPSICVIAMASSTSSPSDCSPMSASSVVIQFRFRSSLLIWRQPVCYQFRLVQSAAFASSVLLFASGSW